MTEQELLNRYSFWVLNTTDDEATSAELADIEGDYEVTDRFYRRLTFGTAGLRGLLGAGDNRMNVYTVGAATQGLAHYLTARYGDAPIAVAIAFDSRHGSALFARESARVLAAAGITAYLFAELQPTPVLSFAVRELGCQAGIMITASHNPALYNGYKCYGAEGFQMTDEDAAAVTAQIEPLDIFADVRRADYEQALADGRIRPVEEALVARYFDRVAALQVTPGICARTPLRVVYTPLNGAGNRPVREMLRRIGVSDVVPVPEQEQPDGDFPTCPYPNPETRDAFDRALALAAELETRHQAPDLLLATDPDGDRVGIAVREGDGYVLMTGNEVGCLLLEYMLSQKKKAGVLPPDSVVITTIVTSGLAAQIARHYGCELREVLTGFKYIGEQIGLLEAAGHPERFLLGFEESYGYLAGTHARDKDAVVGAMLICEMTAFYKSQGQTLPRVLAALYARHGVYRHSVVNADFEGAAGMAAMTALMSRLRGQPPADIAGLRVVGRTDYLAGVKTAGAGGASDTGLPRADVLGFELAEGCGVIVRPSGTEPKIKGYVTAVGETEAEAAALAQRLETAVREMLA